MLAQEARLLTERYRQAWHVCVQEIKDSAAKGNTEVLVFLQPDEIDSVIQDMVDMGYEVQIFHGYVRIKWG
jgi:hypothetical protein